MVNIYDFQKDLQNGMTLEDALQKHGLTFKEAIRKCKSPHSNEEFHNIYLKGNRFSVARRMNRKYVQFGSFELLEDAVRCRDFYEANGWDKNLRYQE